MASYEPDLMTVVVNRAVELSRKYGVDYKRMDIVMDLHFANDQYPLDFAALAVAPQTDFVHDIFGIRRHMDRRALLLTDCFVPRFARDYRIEAHDRAEYEADKQT